MFINLYFGAEDSPDFFLDLPRSVHLRPFAFSEDQFIHSVAEASLTGSLFAAPSGGPRLRYLNFDTSAGLALLLLPLGIMVFPRSCESTV